MKDCFSAECGDPFNVFDHVGLRAGQAFCVSQGFPSLQQINVIFQTLKGFLLMEKNIIRKTQIFVYFEECWTDCNEWLLNLNQSCIAADFSKAIFYSNWMPDVCVLNSFEDCKKTDLLLILVFNLSASPLAM